MTGGTRRFEGRVVLITGAGAGIGLETARRFGSEGARLVIAERRPDRLRSAVGELTGAGYEVAGSDADVTIGSDVRDLIALTSSTFGKLDVLINNAGAEGSAGAVHAVDEEEWDRQVGVNLKSVYLVSHHAWPLLKADGGGVILNASSMVMQHAWPGSAAYCSTKAAVAMLTRCMALDGAPDGIRTACVCPGITVTPNMQAYWDATADPEEAKRMSAAQAPLGLGQPSDIAAAYAYLASDDARFITGSALLIDGGFTAGSWSWADQVDETTSYVTD
jgi:NAD(P)-dependent dehydrogenase (short-subunit alcohol dehydrogenase family)